MWKLCEQVKKTRPAELSKCYAVFISNEGRTVPLWRQKAGRGDDKVVIWVRRNAKQFSNAILTVFCSCHMIVLNLNVLSFKAS